MKKRQRAHEVREKEKETSCTRFHCLKRVSLRRVSLSLFFSRFVLVVLSLSAPYVSIFSTAHFYHRHLAASLQVLFSSRYNFCLQPKVPGCNYQTSRE